MLLPLLIFLDRASLEVLSAFVGEGGRGRCSGMGDRLSVDCLLGEVSSEDLTRVGSVICFLHRPIFFLAFGDDGNPPEECKFGVDSRCGWRWLLECSRFEMGSTLSTFLWTGDLTQGLVLPLADDMTA